MQLSEGIIDHLLDADITAVFGIPGTQTLPLNEAIDGRSELRYVMARHETAVTHQAWGYAETSGSPAATLVVPGPGDMNAMNGLKNAFNDCTPLIHLSIETDPEIRGKGGIHETPPVVYDEVVKENITVESADEALPALQRGIAKSVTPPEGPVRIGIPKRFLSASDVSSTASSFERSYTTDLPGERMAAVASTLRGASTPLIIAGGGIRTAGASEELVAFAEQIDAPVVTTYKGKGVLPETHPLSAGVLCSAASPALEACVDEADVTLGIGTDLDAVSTQQWSFDIDTLVHLTLEEQDFGSGYDPDIAVVADANRALRYLAEALPQCAHEGADRAAGVRDSDRTRIEELTTGDDPPLTSASVVTALREAAPEDTIVSVDAGGFRLWTLVSFAALGPRRYVNPGSWATMGTAVPAAIGAQVAQPDKPVLAIVGDGGLMMCVHELHTIAAEGLPVVTVVLNNNDYAVISDDATTNYDQEGYQWDHAPIDFTAIGRGMHLQGTQVTSRPELVDAVSSALQARSPSVIEIPVDPDEPQAYTWLTG